MVCFIERSYISCVLSGLKLEKQCYKRAENITEYKVPNSNENWRKTFLYSGIMADQHQQLLQTSCTVSYLYI